MEDVDEEAGEVLSGSEQMGWLRPGVRCPCAVAAARPRLVVACLSAERHPTAPNVGSPCSAVFTRFWAVAHAYFRYGAKVRLHW